MIEVLGWIGAIALSLCGLPLLLRYALAERAFLWLWLLGEAAMLGYAVARHLGAVMLANYSWGVVLVATLLVRRRR